MNSERMLLKAKAIDYFQQTGIPKSVEKSLNDLFKVNPSDPYGYLSTYFDKLCPSPTVSRLEAVQCTGDFGCVAMKIIVFGTVKNEEAILSQVCVPNNVSTSPGVPLSSTIINNHNDTVRDCITLISDRLNSLLIGLDPRDNIEVEKVLKLDAQCTQRQYFEQAQNQVDNESKKEEVKSKTESAKKSTMKKGPAIVVTPDDPPEELCPLLRAHSAVSMALVLATSKINKKNLCEYTIERMRDSNEIERTTLPMIAVLRNGKGMPGKCQWIKRCMLMPNGLYASTEKITSDIRLVCLTLCNNLQSKTPVSSITENGELVPSFDRADQFIEVIQETVRECDLEGKMRVVVEVGARGFFDMDKGKYEVVAGQMKSGEEVVAMMTDLVDRYPIIAGLVDPLRTQDKEVWKSLCLAVSDRCWIMGRYPSTIPRAEVIVNQVQQESTVSMSVMCLAVDGFSLFGDYVACVTKMRGEGQMMCMWLDDLSAHDWLMDLACGLQVSLVVLPSPRIVSGASKLDRWALLMSPSTIGSALLFPEIYHESESLLEIETIDN